MNNNENTKMNEAVSKMISQLVLNGPMVEFGKDGKYKLCASWGYDPLKGDVDDYLHLLIIDSETDTSPFSDKVYLPFGKDCDIRHAVSVFLGLWLERKEQMEQTDNSDNENLKINGGDIIGNSNMEQLDS